MMNLLALGLVFTSLLTASVFSPTPVKHSPNDDFVVKEGHRAVVVEYEKDDAKTKVSISPPDEKGHVSNVKDKLSEKMEDAKEKIEELSSSTPQEEGIHHRLSPRELVCDAFGKCKHKLASAIGRTKDMVYEVEEEAKEAVAEAVGKVRDTVAQKTHAVSDKAHEAKESVKEKVHELKQGAEEKFERVKHGAEDVVDKAKGLKEDVKRDASRKMEAAKEKVSEKVKGAEENMEEASEKVKHGAHKVKEEGKKELREIATQARELVYDVFVYVTSSESMSYAMGFLHLLGLAMAYGMSVWVTFISNYVLAKALPEQQFAMVQSKIYPVYFKAMIYSIGLSLMGHLMNPMKQFAPMRAHMLRGLDLLLPMLMVMVNLLYLEPRASKVMFERMKEEKEEGQGKEGSGTEPGGGVADSATDVAGSKETTAASTTSRGLAEERPRQAVASSQIVRLGVSLKRLNSYSSFLNVLTLMSLTSHLLQLGAHLNRVC